MAMSWTQGDFKELARDAHWMKGSGGTAGFHDFTDSAAKLEKFALEEDADECERLIDLLTRMVQAIKLPALPDEVAQERLKNTAATVENQTT